MSPEDVNISKRTANAAAHAKEIEIAKWTAERDAFLRHPEGVQFFEQLNRKIALIVSPRCRNWEDESATNRFQEAFDLVTERMLSVDGFRNVMEKHARYLAEHTEGEKSKLADGKGSACAMPLLSKWDYMVNRVKPILTEWRSSRRDRPTRKELPYEQIEVTATSKPTRDEFPQHELSLRIESLKLQYRATLMLRIWPLQTFPDSWRERYLPLIDEAGEENGLPRAEVKRRLEQVMAKRQSVSEEALLEAEARRGLHFELERHFDLQKRTRFGYLEKSGEFTTASGVETVLQHDCYEAVKKSAEVSVLAMFASEDIFSRTAIGIRKVRNPNWFRRSFCKCCYKQKYHRRIWLNAAVELLNMKPENGPMSHADIGRILNCPENTSYSNLKRARTALLEGGSDDDLGDALQQAAADDSKAVEDAFTQELSDSRLHAIVCEDLKPSAG